MIAVTAKGDGRVEESGPRTSGLLHLVADLTTARLGEHPALRGDTKRPACRVRSAWASLGSANCAHSTVVGAHSTVVGS